MTPPLHPRAFQRIRSRFTLAALIVLGLSFMQDARAQTIPNNVNFRNFFGTMMFHKPVLFAPYPGEDSTYIVLQQAGTILTVRRIGDAWVKSDSARITVNGGTSNGNEQGLLGFAFHPDFRQNRKYYIYHIAGSGSGIDRIAERIADSTLRPHTGDAERTILSLADYASNHNGGTIAFGSDGKLYVGIGDGGNANDALNMAQNLDTLFGKFLRLDVEGVDDFPADTLRNYAVPADNPFVGMPGRKGEIWAYGLRNPWKWSFHPLNGELWVGDVGQNTYEEVSRVPKGGNMGWRLREAAYCFNPSTNCSTPADSLVAPAVTIQRSHGQSVTGGVFFTGDPASAYHGVYIFGDYATDHVWAMRPSGGVLTDSVRIGQVYNVSSFNRDSQGRVFAISISQSSAISANNGVIYVLESPDMQAAPTGLRSGRRHGGAPLRLGDIRRAPDRFHVRDLGGRKASAFTQGVFLVSRKGDAGSGQLMLLP